MAGAVPASPRIQFPSSSGGILPAGVVDVYLAGTTTRTNTWQDKALTVLNTNPIILDVAGSCLLLTDPSQSYKFVVSDVNGAVQYTVDNIMGVGTFPTVAQFVNDKFSGNGSQTTFSLSVTPTGKNNTEVFIAGIYQPKAAYSLVGNAITFVSAPASGTNNIEVNTLNVTDYAAVSANITAQVAAAAASAASAAHIYASTYAVAPVTRPDGSAIQAGDIYFGTDGYEYAYIGGAWVNQTSASAASAAAALVSQNAASTSATSAAGSAGAAATSVAQTQTYASAAATAAKFYDTIALGLAAVADTFTFGVKSGGTDGLLRATLFRRDSSIAWTKIAELIPVTEINPQEDKVGGSLTYVATAAVGATSAGSSLPTGSMWINALPLVAGELQSLSVYVQTLGNGNGRFVIVRPGTPYTVIYVINVTGISGTGLYTLNLPVGYRVNAGDYLGWHMVAGEAQGAYNGGGSNWTQVTASVSVGQTFTPSTTAVTMSVSAVVGVMYQIVENRLTALEAAMQAAYRTPVANGSTTPTGSVLGPPFVWACRDGMTADGFVTSVGLRVSGAATGNLLFIGPNTAGDLVVLGSYPVTLANGVNTIQLGSQAAVTACPSLPDMLWMPAGTRVALQVNSGSYPAYQGSGGTMVFFSTGTTFNVGSSVTLNVSGAAGDAAIELDYLTAPGNPVVAAAFDSIVTATASVASNIVTVSGTLDRSGVGISIKGSQTITLEAGSNIRYDTIYYDPEAGTLGTVSGTARATDAVEFIPAIGDPKRIALFNVRVTNAAVTAVPVWGVFNGENQALENELERERKRSRLYIQKTVGKVRRGASVKVLSLGDSIVAIQNGTPSSATPDGAERDRTTYYLSRIGSDLVNTFPLYTALQLGRADDGAGAVHMQLGFVWELVHAMQAAGSTVVYNNFGVGGTTSANAWSAGATAWLTAAIALAPDIVVLNFGQNEQGVTTTEANMASIVGAFTAAGIEVIVMGCSRPQSGFSATNWKFTNRGLRRAAIYGGAAFLPMLPLYDDPYIGVIGSTTGDVSVANGLNHPGIREHRAIGKELVKLVMGDA